MKSAEAKSAHCGGDGGQHKRRIAVLTWKGLSHAPQVDKLGYFPLNTLCILSRRPLLLLLPSIRTQTCAITAFQPGSRINDVNTGHCKSNARFDTGKYYQLQHTAPTKRPRLAIASSRSLPYALAVSVSGSAHTYRTREEQTSPPNSSSAEQTGLVPPFSAGESRDGWKARREEKREAAMGVGTKSES
eukprot:3939105-Rhodomonas_salina.1